MPRAALRHPVPTPQPQAESAAKSAAAPLLVDDASAPHAAPSAARDLQQRLIDAFDASTEGFPEPVVTRWSPRASLVFIVGAASILWAGMACGLYLALR